MKKIIATGCIICLITASMLLLGNKSNTNAEFAPPVMSVTYVADFAPPVMGAVSQTSI